MFGPLKTLFGLQRRRAEEDADLVGRLDPPRTVLLEDLIADVKRPERLARLGASWIDAGRFTARLAAACAWLEGVAPASGVKGWDGVPLYFFQAASAEEDAAAHRALLAVEAEEPEIFRRYTKNYAHLPLAVQYLPTHTKVCTMLEGRYADADLRLRPLFSTFSTYGQGWVMDGDSTYHAVRGKIVGYRLTDFPRILGVSPGVATDFFARVVVHDLCHGFLPHTPNAAEGFHNAAALSAMGTLPPIPFRDRWEAFIHAEATDPAFCLRAGDEIAGMRKALGIPSMVEEDILDGYRKWYVHPEAARKRREIWGLPEGAGPADLLAKIEAARADGFRINIRHMDPP